MRLTLLNTHAALLAALCLFLPPALFAQRTGGGGTGGGGGYGGGTGGGGLGGSSRTAGTSGGSESTPTIDRPANGQIGSANFYVDPDSRQVFVIADSNTMASVSNVIASMNKPKPQVLIKVVFLEVTYNKGYDVGIEGGVTKTINGSPTTISGSNIFNLAAQGVTPTQGVNTLPGAGLYTVYANDFSATIRAIAEVGKIEVLSRPTILARNNQQATIVVGQQVPLINNVSYDTFGNEHIGIQYQNVGIILQVTPFITSDGMVEMIVAPQISAVDPTQSQAVGYATNGTAITAPYIDLRSANTVVITPDGQTVVIGGLMQNSRSTTDSKIPILGDIPGLGILFHHKISADQKQELIILLTPYVVRSPADLAKMSQDERARAQLTPKAFNQQELNQFIGPDRAPSLPAPPAGTPHIRIQ